jgi:DNA mismatch repair protein MutL
LDLPLAFQRHATSKVVTLADLEAIGTLGFRGEALASIAAVADVTCSSSGRRLRVRATKVEEEGVAAMLPGTVLEVRDLFANTPARLKFLKSDATEQAAIVRTVASYALCHPEVRFRLSIEGRNSLTTEGDGDLLRAVSSVHGKAVGTEMISVQWAVPELRIEVAGVASQPRLSRGSRDGAVFSVNGRPIVSRTLSFALEECYRGRLERGRFPLAVLGLTVDPTTIDVNVHPAKREIKFKDEGAVFSAVQHAVRGGLTESQPYELTLGARVPRPTLESAVPAAQQMALPAATAAVATPSTLETPRRILRPLGQVMDGYLVAEAADGLVLVDQHAAHERVLFNLFQTRLSGGAVISQPLLLPVVLELSPAQSDAANDHREGLERLGFAYEIFGQHAIRVLAGPAETPGTRVDTALEEMLGILSVGSPDQAVHDAASSLACHSAVRFGDQIAPAEQRRLLDDLEAASDSITCPHGRPTRLLLSWDELKLHFRRNY